MFRACLGFSVGQNALGIYFPQVMGQEEGICSPLCLLSQCPCLQTPSPELCSAFLFPAHHIRVQVHTVPVTSLRATSCPVTLPCQPHAQDDVLPPDNLSDGFCWLIWLPSPPSLFPSPKHGRKHQLLSDGLHRQGDISCFSLGWCSPAIFLGPAFIKSSF